MDGISKHVSFSEGPPGGLGSAVPVGQPPRPPTAHDYIVRYPPIGGPVERERYAAVFREQHSEYRALLREIQATRQTFKQLDALMGRLPAHPQIKEEQSRLLAVQRAYRGKEKGPPFLEKQERCDCLRGKLSHLKAQIQAFDSQQRPPPPGIL